MTSLCDRINASEKIQMKKYFARHFAMSEKNSTFGINYGDPCAAA